MNKSLCLKMLLCCILATTSFEYEYTQAQPGEIESVVVDEIGRENPFEQIGPESPEKKQSLFERVFRSERPAEAAPELFVETVTLKFLDAKNLKTALENMLSGYGAIAVDAKSNSLIISDNKKNLEKIIEQARQADRTPRQIVVEVVIVDVQLEDDTQIGVNWDILSDELYDISYRQNLTDRLGSTIESTVTTGNATAFNTTGFGGDFALISGTVRNVVHLLQEKTNLEIIASPKVMVVSGRKAEIRAVDEIPFNELIQTSEGGQLSATSFKDVGVTLKVTATLTEDNEIFLKVDTEQKVETGASETGVPVVDARVANTSLLLKDGQIVAIGGLRQKVTTELVDQIPLLGDLPLVGFLFRSTRTVEINSELVVFLSPHIYKDEPLTEEQMKRFNELKGYPPLEIPRKEDLLPLVEMIRNPNGRSN